jgi:hypothetical protein
LPPRAAESFEELLAGACGHGGPPPLMVPR